MELTPHIVDEVLAACKTGAKQSAASLDRVFGLASTVQPGKPTSFQALSGAKDLQNEGLIIVMSIGPAAALLMFPATGGIVPAWCASPDQMGRSKLDTLARELASNVLPGELIADACHAIWVRNLSQAMTHGGISNDAPLIPLEVSVGGASKGIIGLVWPATQPDRIVSERVDAVVSPASVPEASPSSAPATASPNVASAPPARKSAYPAPPARKSLPPYTRSLLKIKVPVVVTLAEKRQPLGKIIELGPGAIIQFDKSCEEMLDLVVGNQAIASGEAVKVGDKFGLRITSITMPEERFRPVTPSKR